MADEFKVEGLAEALRFMDELPVKVEKNIVRGMIRAAAAPVAEDAQRRAPRLRIPDPRRVIGALAISVRVMSTAVKNGVVKGGVVAGTRARNLKSKLDAFYARFVEYGTAKMTAQPYLRPAIDAKTPAAVDAAAAYVRGRVEAGELTK